MRADPKALVRRTGPESTVTTMAATKLPASTEPDELGGADVGLGVWYVGVGV